MNKDVVLLKNEVTKLRESLDFAQKDIKVLREMIRLLSLKLYGTSSEKMKSDSSSEIQETMFGFEAFDEEFEDEGEENAGDISESGKQAGRVRKKNGRKPLPADLPREKIIHEVEEKERICSCCGKERPELEPKTSERLKYIPAKTVVEVHIRKTYGECPTCAGLENAANGVITAPADPQLIPKSFSTSSLLAYVITSKFIDGLPYYRLEKILKRQKIPLCRSTLSNWQLALGEKCKQLWNILLDEIKARDYMQVDETTFQVLSEKDRKNTTKSYMWVALARAPGVLPDGTHCKIVYFSYSPTRAGQVAKNLLQGVKGCVQTDGYAGYDFLDKLDGVVHAGCWAHTRRKFYEAAVAAQGNSKGINRAKRILGYINKLFRNDTVAKEQGLDVEGILAYRDKESKEVVEKIGNLLESMRGKVAKKTLLGKAVGYALNEWPKLQKFLKNGEIELSTNWVENAIRPFVIGRKGWLFAGSPDGAESSAIMYSLVETAKACGWEPYAYLNIMFERLIEAHTYKEYQQLLPYNLPKP